jgi:hypothetical protein
MSSNYITLTRQELYEMVWSKPMSSLAKDFGISDVALAKRCREVDVPIPYRGYWARKAAGQMPPQLLLPKYRRSMPAADGEAGTRKSLAVSKPVIREGAEPGVRFGLPRNPLVGPEESAASVKEQAFYRQLGLLGVSPASAIPDTCAVVRRTARYKKHPQRTALKFARGENQGPVLHLRVSVSLLDRALLFADHLLRTVQALGWRFAAPPAPATDPHRQTWRAPEPGPNLGPIIGQLFIGDIPIEFHIEEAVRRLSADEREAAPSSAYEPTGRLRLVLSRPYFQRDLKGSWWDRGCTRLEDLLPEILWTFHQLAARLLKARVEREEAERRRQEHERRALELSIRRGHHEKLVAELERQAGAWSRARHLRRYLRALRAAVGEGYIIGKLGEEKTDFLTWAERYVEQLDPLAPAPRVEEMMPEVRYGYSHDSELQSQLGRLLGRDWHQCYKVAAEPSEEAG